MKRVLLAATLLASPALAHTRSSDPVALTSPPADAIVCAGQDATAPINAVLLAGGHVALSAGACLVSAPLTPADGSSLVGAGMQGDGGAFTLLQATAPGFNVVDIGGDRRIKSAIVARLTIDGAATAAAVTGIGPFGEGVHVFPNATGVTITGVEARGNADDGVRIAGSGNTLDHSYVHGNWHDGVFLQGEGPTGAVDANRITGNHVAYNSRFRPPGWEVTHPGEPAGDGINLGQHVSNTLIQGNLVVYNDIRSNQHVGITTGNQAIGNTVQGSAMGGIAFVQNELGVVVSGNTVQNCLPHSLTIGVTSSGTMTGNTVINGGALPFIFGGAALATLAGNVVQ